ncbi:MULTISPECIES: DMT family transporter [unclassified Minwuia]|uniref:DMT family transporter n=1 Tax=unclassified Minwuia TaxID=2618799 RepID=UPI00247A4471|nr:MULTISPECIES: DMT family transporter [unclassified Minwuia]
MRRLFDLPYLLLVLTPLFWAGNFLIGRMVHETVPPVGLAFWRWAVGLLMILPFAWPQLRRDLPVYRANWPIILILSVLGVSCFNTMVYIGVARTEALNASLLQSTMPVWIAVLSFLLFRDRPGPWQVAGILVSLTGVATIIARGDPAYLSQLRFNPGDLWVLTAVICYGGYSALLRSRPAVGPLGFLAVTFAVGDLVLLPFYVHEMVVLDRFVPLNVVALASVLYVSLFASVLAYMFWNRGIELLGANRASVFIHLAPAFVAIGSVILLDEHPQPFHAAGVALILTGVFLTTRRR